jgi:hypothetical protein
MLIYIIATIILLFVLFIAYHHKIKILIGTPIIDRDVDILNEYLRHIKPYFNKYNFMYSCDILFVTRTSDKKIIDSLTKINNPKIILKCVDHYDITDRHNFEHLAKKRQYILNYANENNYDYVFFIDSDVMVKWNTLNLLLNSNVDCCYCPINLHWSDEKIVGYQDGTLFDASTIENTDSYLYNIIGGFGCTLVSKNIFHIPLRVLSKDVIYHGKKQTITGEDIAFYDDCINNKKTTACLLHHDIEHKCHRPINVCVIL